MGSRGAARIDRNLLLVRGEKADLVSLNFLLVEPMGNWKLRMTIAGIVLSGLGGTMVITNPSQTTYEDYALEQLTTYLKDEGCAQIPDVLGDFGKRQCKTIVDSGKPQLREIIAQKTQRQNFILFSLYQTDFSDLGVFPSVPEYQFTTLGVWEQFYIIQVEEN